MIEKSVVSWLKLSTIPRLSNLAISHILEEYENIDTMDDSTLKHLGFNSSQIAAWHAFDQRIIDRTVSWAAQPNRHILIPSSSSYPFLLRQIPDHPKLLFVEGNLDVLALPQIAIVGSRKASAKGLSLAHQFAKELALHDFVITSGLALGIDGRAHRGALDAKGKTIAVFGCGLDIIYPAMHKKLADEIKEIGVLISELFPWSPPKAEFFPKRNRIISGLSTGVLIVEAALRSGSLITARFALEQGRDVFALPSAPDNPYGKGSNGLIKQGAFLVESVQDILSQVTMLTDCAIKHQMTESCDQPLQEELPFPLLLANVGDEVKNVDLLASICQQPVHEIMTQLLELELLGLITAVPGGYIRTRRS